MTRVRVRGFHIFRDRHGKMRCYHRKTNVRVDLTRYPLGSAGFFAACERIRVLEEATAPSRPGTLLRLMDQYQKHPAFTDLAERTQQDYRRVIRYLERIGDTQLSEFTAPLVVKIRDAAYQKHGRRFANYVRTVLGVLLGWAIERGYVSNNPIPDVKTIARPKHAPDPNRPWADHERAAVEAALPAHMRLPIALMMYQGLDPQDALTLSRTAVVANKIDTKRGKTGQSVWVSLAEPVIAAMNEAPPHDAITLCANSRGMPWTVSGFRASWRKIRIKLEKEKLVAAGLTLKGLRHTVATILAEMGKDERTIADVLGQATVEMARHYSRRANRTKKVEATIKDFEEELNKRRTETGKP